MPYDYQITIAPGWLPDGRQGWNLLAEFRERAGLSA